MRCATAVAQKEDHITQTTHPMLSDGIVARDKEVTPRHTSSNTMVSKVTGAKVNSHCHSTKTKLMLPSAFQRAHITTWHITIQKTAVSGEKKTRLWRNMCC